MDYLTYEEYSSIGGALDKTAFDRNIDRACGAIDEATFGRVQEMAEIPKRVKALCRDLVEYYCTNSTPTDRSISSWSESAGDLSESVHYSEKSANDIANDARVMIFEYLSGVNSDHGTPLLYLGGER